MARFTHLSENPILSIILRKNSHSTRSYALLMSSLIAMWPTLPCLLFLNLFSISYATEVLFEISLSVTNRLISNNTSIAYEMLHRFRNRRQGKVGHMAIKLNISKAYDQVKCKFLRKIMLKMGFSGRWVNLAIQGVSSTSYSVLING